MSNKPTAAQKKHFQAIVDMGCVICGSPCEIHHLLTGCGMGQRDHDRVVGLCPLHHRLGNYGVAIHAGIKGFEYANGSETYLLDKTRRLLGEG